MILEKIDGGRDFRYPPRLVLCKRPVKGKLKKDAIIFADVLVDIWYSPPSDARTIELILRFCLPRFRRAIDYYRALLPAALESTA